MMLSEALSELHMIEKRIAGNAEDIERYSSKISTEMPLLESTQRHYDKIRELEQSCRDEWKNYVRIYLSIKLTNLITVSAFEGGFDMCLEEALVTMRRGCDNMKRIYTSMNESVGQKALRQRVGLGSSTDRDRQPHIERFYDEEHRATQVRFWDDLKQTTDRRLGVINNSTPLIDIDLDVLRTFILKN